MTQEKNEIGFEAESFEVTEDTNDAGFYKVKLSSGQFTGVVFNFGKVSFPNEEEAVISFEYDVLEGSVAEADKPLFEKTIGDILIKIIADSIKNKELVFKGGV
jgi:hypothetical protein